MKNAFFRALPELTLPPIQAPCTTFFRHRNSRFESQLRTKNTNDYLLYTYTIIHPKKTGLSSINWQSGRNRLLYWPKRNSCNSFQVYDEIPTDLQKQMSNMEKHVEMYKDQYPLKVVPLNYRK